MGHDRPLIFMDKLQIAINAAKLGAQNAQKYFNTHLEVDLKADKSPVTIADRDTEQKIKGYILSQDPQAKFVGEETGGDYEQDEYWLIDPIDGTVYFSRGIPLWGTLVTFVKNKEAVIGVSYIPFVDELLYAEKGKGAFLNGRPAHVSERNTLQESFITYTSFYRIVNQLPGFTSLCQQSHKAKGLGDSYAFHLLATGRVEAKFDGAALPYDVAGVNLIIEEAGGKVTNFNGEPWTFADGNVIASNGLIHDTLVELSHKDD